MLYVTIPEFFNLVAPEEKKEDVGIGNTIWNVSRAVWVFLASDVRRNVILPHDEIQYCR